ncbi:MAG: DUF1223 domain-containing protein [Sneathiella sp.]|nr:MAG: DUF1223 domain-containing protein [Sneathiella sp.]
MKKNFLQSVFALSALSMTLMAAPAMVLAQSAHQPSSVVELYTSQGCSSCPPADRFLGELVQDKDILGLTFAVTYWDYIGWKDTFGSKDNDLRQVGYKQEFGSRYVYTPQMVIDGKDHKVGSDRSGVRSLIENSAGHAQQLPLTWTFSDNKLEVQLPAGEGEATIWLADIDRSNDVDIGRGENTGHKITYHNVVRKLRSLGNWNGNAKTIVLDLAEMRAMGRDGCALIIQKTGQGPIIAALNVEL